MSYTIGEVVKKTGLSAYTLRYYEKEGLLPFVTKNSSGVRAYTENDLAWLTMIECLKRSGLQLKEICQYIKWFNEGDSTLQKRLELFQNRRKILEQELERLNIVMNKIRYKELLYKEAVRKNSFSVAENEPKFKRLKKKLFDSPSDFDKVGTK